MGVTGRCVPGNRPALHGGRMGAVVLDPSFATGRAYGATGTPSAALVDGEGRIASAIAVGAEAVLALARQEPARAG